MSVLDLIPQWAFIGSAIVVPCAFMLLIIRYGEFHDAIDDSISPWLADWAKQERRDWYDATRRAFLAMILLALFLPFLPLFF